MLANEYDDNSVVVHGAECVRESMNAVLVYVGGDEHWIPKSQLHADSEVYQRGDQGDLIITKWIAKQRDLWEDLDD